MANIGGDWINPRIRILLLPSVNGLEGGWVGRVHGNFMSLGWETILGGQRHEDVERKWEYYHIIIFPEMTWNFTSWKKRTSEHHSDGCSSTSLDLLSSSHLLTTTIILKWREESDTYLTNVCRHRWSGKPLVEIEEITWAFSQHCGFHQL